LNLIRVAEKHEGDTMKWTVYLSLALLAFVLAIGTTGNGASDETGTGYRASDGLVVHEWGVAHFRVNGQAIPEELPEFVHREPEMMEMEEKKPIIYLYAPGEKTVDVKINLARGRMGSWFPGPKSDKEEKKRPWRRNVLELDWSGIKLTKKPKHDLPEIDKAHWWAACRKTQSHYINYDNVSERFLFYESGGVVWQTLKNTKESESNPPALIFKNNDKYTVEDIFRVSLKNDTEGHCGLLKKVDAGKADSMKTNSLKDGKALNALKKDFKQALSKRGLYDSEVKSFMACWEKTLFETKGYRFFFHCRGGFGRSMQESRKFFSNCFAVFKDMHYAPFVHHKAIACLVFNVNVIRGSIAHSL